MNRRKCGCHISSSQWSLWDGCQTLPIDPKACFYRGGLDFGHRNQLFVVRHDRFRAVAGQGLRRKGRLSKPVQRRRSSAEVAELAELYLSASSIAALTSRFHIHRTVVLGPLRRYGIAGRRSIHQLTDSDIVKAAGQHRFDPSLATVAAEYRVHERTITREFRPAGVPLGPSRGWNP